MSRKDVEEILQRIESGKPDALSDGLYGLTAQGDEAIEPLIQALRSESPLVRWAGAAALGELGATNAIDALLESLRDPNVSVRIRAAQSLAKLGRTEGIPALIEALESDEVIIGHPPELAADYANRVLESVTGQRFGFDASAGAEERRASVEAWRGWWRENQGKL